MATPSGRTDPPLDRVLFDAPYRFEFFQAVRLLRRLYADRVRVGVEGPPRREAVRFRAQNSLAFPASEVPRIDPPAEEGAPPSLTVAFMGLTGPLGVLPRHYTEFAMARRRERDETLAAFFDLFNHRMVSLFFRAWEKYRPALAREGGGPDPLAAALLALMGLGTAGLGERHVFPDAALLLHAGSFAQRRRPAIMLERLLRQHFGLEVEVRQFTGRWLALDPADRSALGPDGPHNGLGTGLTLGARIWDEQGKFRLRLGPLTYQQFLRFLPDGPEFVALCQMTRLFVDGGLDFDVQLVLKADEVPGCRLARGPAAGPRLGRYAWVKSRPATEDAEDAVFLARA
jgi:type VI secretion system protein ImpH